MRLEAFGPRTWLLATVAGWAVVVLLLALLGMGGNIARLADDPALVRALPAMRPAPAPRIGPLAQYAEAATRPLFNETRRPQPFSLQPESEAEQAPEFDFVLTSVLRTPSLQMAIVQPSAGGESIRMRLGESPEEAQGWRLVELHARSAVFEGPQGQKTLDLRTFDGAGGEPPTAVAAPAPVPAGVAPPQAPQPAVVRDADAIEPVPAPVPQPARRPVAPTTTTQATSTAPTTPEAQMDAIRRRIEARRAQLRAEAQQEARQQQQKTP